MICHFCRLLLLNQQANCDLIVLPSASFKKKKESCLVLGARGGAHTIWLCSQFMFFCARGWGSC